MLLDDRRLYEKGSFEIFASDLNQAVLARARRGKYRENSFRATPPAMRDRYFLREPDGSWRIHDAIRNRVSFGRLNLYDDARVSLLGLLDVVFCRNVIIYFDEGAKRNVIASFYNRLIDGGYLLLGHSESLMSLSTQFKLRHLTHDMVYQK
jgi:chemotaxis protein methyltransferase CheR